MEAYHAIWAISASKKDRIAQNKLLYLALHSIKKKTLSAKSKSTKA
jgi:hypothetical protein